MKIYKYILESAGDINWLAIIPLIIFFVFFVGMVIYVLKTNKSFNDRMSRLPLENDQ